MQSRLAETGEPAEMGGDMLPRNVGDIYMGDLSRVRWMLQKYELGCKKEARAGTRGADSRGDTPWDST